MTISGWKSNFSKFRQLKIMKSRLVKRGACTSSELNATWLFRAVVDAVVEDVKVRGHGATSVEEKDVQKSVVGSKESSGSDLFVRDGLVRLSQKASVSMPIHSTDTGKLSRLLVLNNER